jgi:thioredoxin-like negative regulator of GroEL
MDGTRTKQQVISRQIGIDQGYMSKLLSGRYTPKRATPKINALCQSAGIRLADFMRKEAPAPGNAKALLSAAARVCGGQPRKERALEQLLRVLEKFESDVH